MDVKPKINTTNNFYRNRGGEKKVFLGVPVKIKAKAKVDSINPRYYVISNDNDQVIKKIYRSTVYKKLINSGYFRNLVKQQRGQKH